MQKVKEQRQKKGFSQEQLAELTGLNIRTIQRIENGETEARGDSLRKITKALDIEIEDLTDDKMEEDLGVLHGFNLINLVSLITPIIGLIVAAVFWLTKRNKIRGLNKQGVQVFNFQITTYVLYSICFLIGPILLANEISDSNNISPSMITDSLVFQMNNRLVYSILIVIMVVYNATRISKGKALKYYPSLRIIR